MGLELAIKPGAASNVYQQAQITGRTQDEVRAIRAEALDCRQAKVFAFFPQLDFKSIFNDRDAQSWAFGVNDSDKLLRAVSVIWQAFQPEEQLSMLRFMPPVSRAWRDEIYGNTRYVLSLLNPVDQSDQKRDFAEMGHLELMEIFRTEPDQRVEALKEKSFKYTSKAQRLFEEIKPRIYDLYVGQPLGEELLHGSRNAGKLLSCLIWKEMQPFIPALNEEGNDEFRGYILDNIARLSSALESRQIAAFTPYLENGENRGLLAYIINHVEGLKNCLSSLYRGDIEGFEGDIEEIIREDIVLFFSSQFLSFLPDLDIDITHSGFFRPKGPTSQDSANRYIETRLKRERYVRDDQQDLEAVERLRVYLEKGYFKKRQFAHYRASNDLNAFFCWLKKLSAYKVLATENENVQGFFQKILPELSHWDVFPFLDKLDDSPVIVEWMEKYPEIFQEFFLEGEGMQGCVKNVSDFFEFAAEHEINLDLFTEGLIPVSFVFKYNSQQKTREFYCGCVGGIKQNDAYPEKMVELERVLGSKFDFEDGLASFFGSIVTYETYTVLNPQRIDADFVSPLTILTHPRIMEILANGLDPQAIKTPQELWSMIAMIIQLYPVENKTS